MAATLGYWKLRGNGHQIRFLLEYTGLPYTEKLYVAGHEWFDEKFSLGLDFPNLPYYIDGEVKLSQTYAIMRYIARKSGMEPKNDVEKLRVDLLECVLGDMRMQWVNLLYESTHFENDKKIYTSTTYPSFLKQLSAYLGDRKWFAGNNLTHVDFAIFESFEINEMLNPGCVKKFEKLEEFRRRFAELEAVEKYMKSERYFSAPINGTEAHFNGGS